MLGLLRSQMGAHTCMHTQDVYTLTRTAGISYWLSWPILLRSGAELSTGADARNRSQKGQQRRQ